MKEFKGEKLCVAIGASQARRWLKGHGFGVRRVYSDGKNRAVIIHTATGEHLQELEDFSYLNIPAHARHRVAWTDPNQKTLWLAIYYRG